MFELSKGLIFRNSKTISAASGEQVSVSCWGMDGYENVDMDTEEILQTINTPSVKSCFRIFVLHPDETIDYMIPDEDIKTGGSYDENYQSGQRRSLSFSLVNDTGKYTPSVNRLWAGTRFRLEMGVKVNDNQTFWFSKGSYVISSVSVTESAGDRSVQVQAGDKFTLFTNKTGSLDSSYTIPVGVEIEKAIRGIQSSSFGNGEVFDVSGLEYDSSFKGKTVQSEISQSQGGTYGALLLELATQLSAEIFYNSKGVLTLVPIDAVSGDSDKPILCDLVSDRGDVSSFSFSYNMDDMINKVVVVGNSSDGAVHRAVAVNDNPDSPFCFQRIGYRMGSVISDNNITTDYLAEERARYELRNVMILQTSSSFPVVYNPLLAVNNTVTFFDDFLGINGAKFLIKGISVPLDNSGTMSVSVTSLENLAVHKLVDRGYVPTSSTEGGNVGALIAPPLFISEDGSKLAWFDNGLADRYDLKISYRFSKNSSLKTTESSVTVSLEGLKPSNDGIMSVEIWPLIQNNVLVNIGRLGESGKLRLIRADFWFSIRAVRGTVEGDYGAVVKSTYPKFFASLPYDKFTRGDFVGFARAWHSTTGNKTFGVGKVSRFGNIFGKMTVVNKLSELDQSKYMVLGKVVYVKEVKTAFMWCKKKKIASAPQKLIKTSSEITDKKISLKKDPSDTDTFSVRKVIIKNKLTGKEKELNPDQYKLENDTITLNNVQYSGGSSTSYPSSVSIGEGKTKTFIGGSKIFDFAVEYVSSPALDSSEEMWVPVGTGQKVKSYAQLPMNLSRIKDSIYIPGVKESEEFQKVGIDWGGTVFLDESTHTYYQAVGASRSIGSKNQSSIIYKKWKGPQIFTPLRRNGALTGDKIPFSFPFGVPHSGFTGNSSWDYNSFALQRYSLTTSKRKTGKGKNFLWVDKKHHLIDVTEPLLQNLIYDNREGYKKNRKAAAGFMKKYGFWYRDIYLYYQKGTSGTRGEQLETFFSPDVVTVQVYSGDEAGVKCDGDATGTFPKSDNEFISGSYYKVEKDRLKGGRDSAYKYTGKNVVTDSFPSNESSTYTLSRPIDTSDLSSVTVATNNSSVDSSKSNVTLSGTNSVIVNLKDKNGSPVNSTEGFTVTITYTSYWAYAGVPKGNVWEKPGQVMPLISISDDPHLVYTSGRIPKLDKTDKTESESQIEKYGVWADDRDASERKHKESQLVSLTGIGSGTVVPTDKTLYYRTDGIDYDVYPYPDVSDHGEDRETYTQDSQTGRINGLGAGRNYVIFNPLGGDERIVTASPESKTFMVAGQGTSGLRLRSAFIAVVGRPTAGEVQKTYYTLVINVDKYISKLYYKVGENGAEKNIDMSKNKSARIIAEPGETIYINKLHIDETNSDMVPDPGLFIMTQDRGQRYTAELPVEVKVNTGVSQVKLSYTRNGEPSESSFTKSGVFTAVYGDTLTVSLEEVTGYEINSSSYHSPVTVKEGNVSISPTAALRHPAEKVDLTLTYTLSYSTATSGASYTYQLKAKNNNNYGVDIYDDEMLGPHHRKGRKLGFVAAKGTFNKFWTGTTSTPTVIQFFWIVYGAAEDMKAVIPTSS